MFILCTIANIDYGMVVLCFPTQYLGLIKMYQVDRVPEFVPVQTSSVLWLLVNSISKRSRGGGEYLNCIWINCLLRQFRWFWVFLLTPGVKYGQALCTAVRFLHLTSSCLQKKKCTVTITSTYTQLFIITEIVKKKNEL